MSIREKSLEALVAAGSSVARAGGAVVFTCCALPELGGTRFLSNLTIGRHVVAVQDMTVADWHWLQREIEKQISLQVCQVSEGCAV